MKNKVRILKVDSEFFELSIRVYPTKGGMRTAASRLINKTECTIPDFQLSGINEAMTFNHDDGCVVMLVDGEPWNMLDDASHEFVHVGAHMATLLVLGGNIENRSDVVEEIISCCTGALTAAFYRWYIRGEEVSEINIINGSLLK